jgi:outer membrane protein OmpA-like peptidoglycan-associated protein
VGEEVLFETGSAEVADRYHAVAALGVAVMQLYPNATMTIVGHTDDVGSVEANYSLSLARARAVADYLARLGNLDPARFTAEGRGPSQPVAPNDSDTNRAKNRRIEVEIHGLFK